MDGSSSKTEVMKPVILKAGIPLAISVAGYMFSRFLMKTNTNSNISSSDNQIDSSENNPCSDSPGDNNQEEMGLIENPDIHIPEDEILSIKSWIEELQKREYELKMQFLHYRDLKQQESNLMELRNMLKLEKTRVEFFHKEVSSKEAENKRLHDLAVIHMEALEQIQGLRSENGLLKRKVKGLKRRKSALLSVIAEKNLVLGSKERELLRSLEELEVKCVDIGRREDEIRELKAAFDGLKDVNNELLNKLNSDSKIEIEYGGMTVRTEDYEQLLTECEDLQRKKADEEKELIYLRWSNACLRRELLRIHGQQEQDLENRTHKTEMSKDENFENQLHKDSILMSEESGFGITTGDSDEHIHGCSRRRRIMKKLKKWVEGNERKISKLDEKERNEIKCFGRLSVSDEAEDQQTVLARRSCSSA